MPKRGSCVIANGRGARAAPVPFLLALLIAAASFIPYAAGQANAPPRITSFAGTAPVLLLRDADRGTTLYARNARQSFVPASLVKVMTAYVILDAIKAGKLSRDQHATVPADLVARWRKWPRASSMRLRSGEKVSVDALLHGMITASGNDAAELLALTAAPSVDDFIAQMNRTARRLGMKNSRFGTVTGWPDGGRTQVTAEDLAILAERLLRDHPAAYRRYFGNRNYERAGLAPLVNRNPLLGRYNGADGMKTGHISSAGYTFIGSASRDGKRLIVIMAGAESLSQRASEAAALLDAGFAAMNRPATQEGRASKP